MARLAERASGIPTHLSYVMLELTRGGERRAIDTLWSRLMTDHVLVMALPTETLRLGRDIPTRHRDLPFYPTALRHLSERTTATSTPAAPPVPGDLAEKIRKGCPWSPTRSGASTEQCRMVAARRRGIGGGGTSG